MNVTDIADIIAEHKAKDANLDDEAGLVKKLKAKFEKAEKAAREAGENSTGSIANWFRKDSKAAQDPVEVMRSVFKDKDFSVREQNILFYMSRERFQNRRKMAYYALYVLLLAAVLLMGAIIYDGLVSTAICTAADTPIEGCTVGKAYYPLAESIKMHTELLKWMGGFFVSIIAFYFGASSFRPTS